MYRPSGRPMGQRLGVRLDGLRILKTPSHVSLPAPAFCVLIFCGGVKTHWVRGNEIRVGESDERDKFGNVLRWLPGYVGSLLSIPSWFSY